MKKFFDIVMPVKTAACYIFTATMCVYAVLDLVFGWGGLPDNYLFSFLLLSLAGGVLLAKVMNKLSGGKINPLIGSAGVSAVPMAARVSQKVGAEADPTNFLLMHAMGPNVAGVIGTAVAAGTFMAIFGVK